MKITLNSVFRWRIPVALTLFLFTPALAQWQTVLTIEAEDFVSSTAGTAISDGWVLPDSGSITDWVFFHPSMDNVRITVVARGTPVIGVWPYMGLSFDQHLEVFKTVDVDKWKAYTFDLTASAGERQIGVWNTIPNIDTNDFPSLYIDRYEIAVPVDTPMEYWPVHISQPTFLTKPGIPTTDSGALPLTNSQLMSLRTFALGGGIIGFGVHIAWHSSTGIELSSSGPHAIQGAGYTLVGMTIGVLLNLTIKFCKRTLQRMQNETQKKPL